MNIDIKDRIINIFEFKLKKLKAKFQNDELHYGLGYSTNTNLTTRLFPGAIYDSYKLDIYIQAYDVDGAYRILQVTPPVRVVPDVVYLGSVIEKIISGDPYYSSNIILNEGAFVQSIQELQSISSLLNEQSLSDKVGLLQLQSEK